MRSGRSDESRSQSIYRPSPHPTKRESGAAQGPPGKPVTIKEWECFDADREKIRRGRYGSIRFRTSASRRTVMRIRRRWGSWSAT